MHMHMHVHVHMHMHMHRVCTQYAHALCFPMEVCARCVCLPGARRVCIPHHARCIRCALHTRCTYPGARPRGHRCRAGGAGHEHHLLWRRGGPRTTCTGTCTCTFARRARSNAHGMSTACARRVRFMFMCKACSLHVHCVRAGGHARQRPMRGGHPGHPRLRGQPSARARAAQRADHDPPHAATG